MDLLLSLIIFVTSILCFLLLGHIARIRNGLNTSNKALGEPVPEASGKWPIVGHLYLLAGSQVPHKVLGSLADKIGPIFTIKLGAHQVLVVSNSEMAKECLTTKAMATELMACNYANFSLSPYGPYWREIRKIVVLDLVSHRRLQMLKRLRVSEVNLSMVDMYRTWRRNKGSLKTVKVDMRQWFGNLVVNVVVRMIFGSRFLPGDRTEDHFKKAVRQYVELLGAFVPSDVVPGLRWLDIGGYKKKMKKTAKVIDNVIDAWLQEHKMKMNCEQKLDDSKDQVFMTTLISRVNEELKEDRYDFKSDEIVKATCYIMN